MVSPADPPPLRQTGLVALDFGAVFRASAQAPQPATAQWGGRLGGLDFGPHSDARSRAIFPGQDAAQDQPSS